MECENKNSTKNMITLNEKYFNLIENEWFVVFEGPITRLHRGPYYKVLWEDGTSGHWGEDELIEWLDDHELNIKIDDDKHLLLLRLKHSDKNF